MSSIAGIQSAQPTAVPIARSMPQGRFVEIEGAGHSLLLESDAAFELFTLRKGAKRPGRARQLRSLAA